MGTRATAERAAAAARAMSSADIAAADERVKSIIASDAKPVR
jgi:hypothetical protein